MTRLHDAQKKAIKLIPGMTGLLSKRPDLYSFGVWPSYYKKAHGVTIWDLDDRAYTDMSIGGIGANILGYCDPDVDAAVLEAVKHGSSSSLNCYEDVELAQLLCDLHPWSDMVRYARTGGEAMAVAVRIARAHTGKDIVAFCGYHGWHDWYLAANLNADSALDGHLIPGLSPAGVPRGLEGTSFPFAYNRLQELEAIVQRHGRHLGAIIMEPLRNFNPDPEFIAGVRNAADQTGAVLIVDEISAGFRFNTGGAHLEFFQPDCMPDIAVFSKALGNGYPIAAVIGKGHIMESAQDTFISSTYWTERIGPAAAIAMIKKHRRINAGSHLETIGDKVQKGWHNIAQQHGFDIEVAGIKQMTHFSFQHEKALSLKAYFIQEMLDLGFLASTIFYAMAAHTPGHVKNYLTAADDVFGRMRKALDAGNLEKKLRGQLPKQGFKRIA